MTQKTLQNRQAVKMNEMMLGETGTVYISKRGDQGTSFPLFEVKSRLINGDFDNTVSVFVGGVNGQCGPNIKPSQKSIKRLLSVIRHTTYRVVQQSGQNFMIEGEN